MVEIRRQRRRVSSAFRWDLLVKVSLEVSYRREAWEEACGWYSAKRQTHAQTCFQLGKERRERRDGEVEIGSEGSEEGKGRWTVKF